MMVVSKDDDLLDEESLARVKLISDKKRQLEETADQVRNDIKGCFERLTQALKGRERQLLRQVEAIHRQQLSLVQSKSELLPAASSDLQAKLSDEQELMARLLNFGKIELANSIAVNDCEPYKAEEYLEASEDVVSFDKSLKSDSDEIDVSSVIRRKRDSSGNHTKNITINLDCASRDTRKIKADVLPAAVAGPSKPFGAEDSPATPASSSSGSSSTNVSCAPQEEAVPMDIKSPMACGSPADPRSPGRASDRASENVFFVFGAEGASVKCESDRDTENNASKSPGSQDNDALQAPDKKTEHSIQIQQWLQKILTETETEPIIHEIGQFSSIPNSRLYREFPVET